MLGQELQFISDKSKMDPNNDDEKWSTTWKFHAPTASFGIKKRRVFPATQRGVKDFLYGY